MFYLLFGNYLVKHNVLTATELLNIKNKLEETRTKLGLIAISEGLITTSQAEEINRIQTSQNKHFGDIAIENGYLTQTQVDNLLSLEDNSYFKFIQILVDEKDITLDTIISYLKDYQSSFGYTDCQMAILKTGDIKTSVPLLLNLETSMHKDLATLAILYLIRHISNDIYIENCYETKEYSFENLAIQSTTGDHIINLGLSGEEASLLQIANIFAGEEFLEIDADSYDAICEFINCINGSYAAKMSENDVQIDMLPPYFYSHHKLTCNHLVVVTLKFNHYTFDLVLSIDDAIEYV